MNRNCSGKMLMVLPQSLSSCFSSSLWLYLHHTETNRIPGERNIKFFGRNSCNFNRFTLFLCYYVLSVFMFHSLLVPSSSSSSSSYRLCDFGSCQSHTVTHSVCVCGSNLVAFFVKWNFTTTFVLVYAVFYFVSASSFHLTQRSE